MEDQVSGVKRKAAASSVGGADAASAVARRDESTASGAVIAPAGRLVGDSTFNEFYLKYFYSRLFPYKLMFRWLAYGNDPDSQSTSPLLVRDFFSRREWNFTMEGDVFVRYLNFRDADELAKAIIAKQPHKIDIGAVFNAKPSTHATVKNFAPLQRELVFDIDMDAYDEIRNCCKGAKLCSRCWSFINVAVKVLDVALRDDFGFSNVLFIYSGRRGMHCWVCDEKARKLDNLQRSSVAEYLSVLVTGHGGGAARADAEASGEGAAAPMERNAIAVQKTANTLSIPLHPALSRAYTTLEEVFESFIITEKGQGLLSRPENFRKILDAIPADLSVSAGGGAKVTLRDVVQQQWDNPSATAQQRWSTFKDLINSAIFTAGGVKDAFMGKQPKGVGPTAAPAVAKASGVSRASRKYLEALIPAVVFTFSYPRLDIDVSKTMNHLLKAPFCIHPKTGRVCVPIDPVTIDSFDPTAVPTVAQLTEEATLYSKANNSSGASSSASASSSAMDEDAPAGGAGGAGSVASSSSSGPSYLTSDLWRHTSLRPYLEFFEKFVKGCEGAAAVARAKEGQKMVTDF